MKILLVLVAILFAIPASAGTYCIPSGDVTALNLALLGAQTNGEDDLIQLQSGQFDLTADLVHASAEPNTLSIEGGYGDFFGNPCGLAPGVPNASQTVMDGVGTFRLHLLPSGGALTIRALTITGMYSGAQESVAFQGTSVSVANVTFSHNQSLSDAGVGLYATEIVQVQNSLFHSINGANGYPAIFVQSTGSFLCNEFINTTIANNLSSESALYITSTDPACFSVVANSVLWGNSSTDLAISSETFLDNNDLSTISVVSGPIHPDLESFNADPLFNDPSNGDYGIRDESPLRDRGSTGGFVWVPGDWDVIGNPRVYNGTPDIGAFEVQDVIFASGFN